MSEQQKLPTEKKVANERKKSPQDELVGLGKSVIRDIDRGQNPRIELSVRGLSNVVYDTKSKTLGLGDKTAQRFFFNVAHAKKFLQTIEVAAICKSLLDIPVCEMSFIWLKGPFPTPR